MRKLGLLLVPLSIHLGCGSDDAKIAPDEFASRYADLVCPRLSPCCTAAGEQNDVAACKSLLSLLSSTSKLKFNAEAADACLEALAGWACTEPEPDVCDNVLTGSVPVGGECKSNADCAAPVQGGVTCHFDYSGGSTTKGKCKIEPPPAVGQPCGADAYTETQHFVCEQAPELYCASGTCEKKAAVGESCVGYGTCAPGAYCASGTCAALAAVGESCGAVGCVEGAYCATTGTCAKKKAMGETCQNYNECEGSCDTQVGKCHPSATLCFSS